MADESKTEQPTSHRLSEARKKGQVFKSQEFTFAISVMAFLLFLHSTARNMILSFVSITREACGHLDVMSQGVQPVLVKYGFFGLKIAAPFLVLSLLVIVLANLSQIGFLFNTSSLAPKLDKLNPIEGFKRIYSRRGLFEMAKNVTKIVIVYVISAAYIKKLLATPLYPFNAPLMLSMSYYAEIIYTLCLRIALIFLVLGVVDYLYQRHEYYENMKMTKQEIKEEYKMLEGDPFLKQRQFAVRSKLARSRMMEGVKKARVVVTNPTHIACALQYDDSVGTPVLVAKGQGFVAKNIAKKAREHKIPVIENKPVAWALYNNVEIDEEIPGDLYATVAEVIIFVMQLEEDKPTGNDSGGV
jgi:flagellar biosynthetic protein FlhB